MFACKLFVRIRTNSPYLLFFLFVRMRTNSPCLQDHVSVYAIHAYADEQPVFECTLFFFNADELPVFACTLFVRMRTNSPCLHVRYSCGCGRIARVYVYAIRADVEEKKSVCVYAIRAVTDEKPIFACYLFVRMRK